MTQLRFPLKDYLLDPVDEATIIQLGERIDARTQRRPLRRALPFALAGVTALAAIIVVASVVHRNPGPLLFADGHDLVAMDAGAVAKEIALSDGSRIHLSPGAHIEPLESSGTRFSAIVTQGRADFEVRPGGPRHWIIECGLASVEVVGTAFTCERQPGRLRLTVRHGAVLARGELVPDRARRLSAGETMELVEETRHSVLEADDTPGLPDAPILAGPPAPETAPQMEKVQGTARARLSSGKTWRELARHGRNGEAFASLGAEGLRRESKRLGVNDLLALADVARLSGHPAEAVPPLQRILTEFANDGHAPLAAFALGRLELDSLGHAQAAASAFRKSLALGIPKSLREDVRARLVEAHARSGDAAAARRAADAYLQEFPNGRHSQAIQVWLRLR
jgi:transmembrane sensor